MATPRTLAELLGDLSARVERLEPAAAHAALLDGALLVDLRSDTSRGRDGIVSGSLHVPRTVLEWRFAPDSEWRTPYAEGSDQRVLLLCGEGYSSLIAASSLADLGLTNVGDVIGGYAAWRAAGLPTMPMSPRPSTDDALPGMGPLD